jgi:hypothetical protein
MSLAPLSCPCESRAAVDWGRGGWNRMDSRGAGRSIRPSRATCPGPLEFRSSVRPSREMAAIWREKSPFRAHSHVGCSVARPGCLWSRSGRRLHGAALSMPPGGGGSGRPPSVASMLEDNVFSKFGNPSCGMLVGEGYPLSCLRLAAF